MYALVALFSFVAVASAQGDPNVTAGVTPRPIHSHNDYLQNVPLFDALASGCSSVEADVWWINNTLFVGHVDTNLTANRTLDSLYVQPLLTLLKAANPNGVTLGIKPNGVFQTSPNTTLQLLIDFKSDGAETFQPVTDALAPLRDAGFLTYATNGVVHESAITAVGSGNTPFTSVVAQSPRTVFLDAPLNKLNSSHTADVAPLASADLQADIVWFGILPLDPVRRAVIKGWFGTAHKQGEKARFYNTAASPTFARNTVWKELLDDGEDWLNADDLPAAAAFYDSWKAGQ